MRYGLDVWLRDLEEYIWRYANWYERQPTLVRGALPLLWVSLFAALPSLFLLGLVLIVVGKLRQA